MTMPPDYEDDGMYGIRPHMPQTEEQLVIRKRLAEEMKSSPEEIRRRLGMTTLDDDIIDGLAAARFGKQYTGISEHVFGPRWRTMRENVAWALPYVKQMMAKAYSEGQDAGFEDCLAEAEDKSPNPYEG